MMDVLMLAALMAAVFFVVRMMRRPRQENTARPMQYSGMGTTGGSSPVTGERQRRQKKCLHPVRQAPTQASACDQEYR